MAVTKLNTKKRVFSDAKYLYFTPWKDEDSIGDTTYDLVSIVGDTISVEQEDNTVDEKPHEFSDQPLFENVTLGKWNFAATCIDFQNEVMKSLFGWIEDEAVKDKAVYAPDSYQDLFCKVEIGFGAKKPVVVIPKLKMNSKAAFQNLKSGTAEGMLNGTAYNAYIKVGSGKEHYTPLAIIPASTEGASQEYTVSATASAGSVA